MGGLGVAGNINSSGVLGIGGNINCSGNINANGAIIGSYYNATNSFSLLTNSLTDSSYFGYNSLGSQKTNLINSSSGFGGGGFYFIKTPEFAGPKLLMCITGEGNVGINKETPTEKLEVAGDVFINNGTSKLYLGVKNNYILSDVTNMAIRTNGNLNIQDTNATVQKMTIKSDGKIGIGSTAPTEKLEISSGDVFINNSTSKLYLGLKTNYILGDVTNMAIRTNGDLCIQDTNAVVQKMTIKSDGKIGIGTSTPSTTLNVNGTINSSSSINASSSINSSSSITAPYLLAYNKAGLLTQGLAQGSYYGWNSTSSGGETNFVNVIPYTLPSGFQFSQKFINNRANTTLMRIRGDSSNVGIGTDTPTTKLDVVGDIKSSISVISSYFNAQVKSNFFGQFLGKGFYWCWNSSNSQGETNFVNVIYSGNFGGFTFSTKAPSSKASTNLMRIKGYGNVGIGTDTTTEKLDILGTIKATDIKATNYNDTNGNKMLLQNCYWSGIIDSTHTI